MDLAQTAGAGFIVSNVLDYTKWIRAMIDQALPISKAGHAALRSPRAITNGIRKDSPYTGIEGYSLGWDKAVYKGYEVFQHAGGMEAFGAEVVFFPELQYGLVAFGNIAGWSNYAEERLIWHLVDEKLGTPKEERFDWNKK
jgi:CubicO group peptidase (beta-lactamase class C family)